ncbi:hydrolase 76 protein [Podochytrium sp. JEL0797]|nr:hydrolase 76 protein [Podochytrium sp. JEL0797]
MHPSAVLALLASTAFAQGPSIDLTNQAAVVAAAKAAMPALKQYFADNTPADGAWNQPIVQWHETGIYWDLFYQYYAYTGDATYNVFVDTEMQLSVGIHADFLDGVNPMQQLAGRWNDDIGWWATATMTAAEATQNGIIAPFNMHENANPEYVKVTANTWDQMYMNWDDLCGGGIYWSRDRTSTNLNNKLYKSSITNAQFVEIGARLYALTGNATYKELADKTYKWMLSTVIDPATYVVIDGIYADASCTKQNDLWSYHTGELIGGMASFYKTTKDPNYLAEAQRHLSHIQNYFTADNVLVDPACATSGTCKSPSGYMWCIYKGLAALYAASADVATRSTISTMLQASAKANFVHCNAQWYCIRDLPAGTPATMPNGTNPRDQFETVAILNALAIVTGATASSHKQDAPTVGPPQTDEADTKGPSKMVLYAQIAGGVAAALVLIGAIAWCIRSRSAKQKRREMEEVSFGMSEKPRGGMRNAPPVPGSRQQGYEKQEYARQQYDRQRREDYGGPAQGGYAPQQSYGRQDEPQYRQQRQPDQNYNHAPRQMRSERR